MFTLLKWLAMISEYEFEDNKRFDVFLTEQWRGQILEDRSKDIKQWSPGIQLKGSPSRPQL